MRTPRISFASVLALSALALGAAPASAEDEPILSPEELAHEAGADAHHGDGDTEHAIDRIVVTGTPLEHDRDELAVPADRLDREELLTKLGATLGDTLSGQPGIATSGFSGGASRPVIRGQDAFRTEVLEDGLPTQDVSRESPDHAIPVNPLSIERVEVVRGPAILRYGGGAAAGVVNAISNRVPDELVDESVYGEMYGAYGSVANAGDFAMTLDGATGPVALHADGLVRRSDDYEIPTGGRQRGTFSDAYNVSAGAAWFIGASGRIGAAYTHAANEYGIPELDEDARIDMRTDRVRLEGDWLDPVAGVHEVRVRGLFSDYTHDEIVEGEVGQTFHNQQFDGRLEVLHHEVFGFHGAAGLTGRWRELEALGEAFEYLAPTLTTQAAGYLFEEREIVPDWVLELGLRVEGTSVSGTPAGAVSRVTRSFVPVSGSLGLVGELCEGLSIGLLGAVSQRAPAESELFARGPHEATGTYELGDSELGIETSYTGEVHITWSGNRHRLEAAGFGSYYSGYIFGALTGVTRNEDGAIVPPDDPDAFDELLYLARNATFVGVELSGDVDLLYAFGGVVGAAAQFDWVRARFDKGVDRNLPRITPIRWGGTLYFEHERARLGIGFLRTEAQRDVALFEAPTGGHTFLNASLILRLDPFGRLNPVEISLIGTNLTDAQGRNHVSFNAQTLLLPGRNVRAAMRVSF